MAQTIVPLQAARDFGASMAASTFATLLTQPVDVIRTRLQLHAPSDSAGKLQWTTGTVVVRSLTELVRKEGAAALFTGGVSRILKRSLSTAVTWTLFEEAMRSSSGS